MFIWKHVSHPKSLAWINKLTTSMAATYSTADTFYGLFFPWETSTGNNCAFPKAIM